MLDATLFYEFGATQICLSGWSTKRNILKEAKKKKALLVTFYLALKQWGHRILEKWSVSPS